MLKCMVNEGANLKTKAFLLHSSLQHAQYLHNYLNAKTAIRAQNKK